MLCNTINKCIKPSRVSFLCCDQLDLVTFGINLSHLSVGL